MKLVRGAAVLVGLLDLAFALLFLISPQALDKDVTAVYPRWLGVCLLASAVMLFIIASDPERYLPLLYVNVGARIVAVLVGLLYITKAFTLVVTIAASDGALSAILVAALAYAARQERAVAAPSGPERKAEPKPKTKPSGGGKKDKAKKG